MKTFNVENFVKNYSENIHKKEPWKNIEQVAITGFFNEDIPNKNGHFDNEYAGRLYKGENSSPPFPSLAIGASIKDIVPNPEKLYGKKVRIYGLTTASYLPLYNLETITKVEVLDEKDEVIETYDSNEKSKANLREFFERMDFAVPEEFKLI